MNALKLVATCLAATSLAGCAGISQLVYGPITSDRLDEPTEMSKLKSVSGDYRLVRTTAGAPRNDGPDLIAPGRRGMKGPYYHYKICAETQADAIIARGASSALVVGEKQSLNDAATQAALLTNQRSAVSDVVRHLTWTLCNARMNGDITEPQYQAALLKLQNDAMVVLQQIALGPNSAVLPLQSSIEVKTVMATVAPAAATAPPANAPQPAKEQPKAEEKPKSAAAAR